MGVSMGMEKKKINIKTCTNRCDLEHHKLHMISLEMHISAIRGWVNAVKLYYKCVRDKIIEYLDITSMYPHVMSVSHALFYPIKILTI